MRPIKKLIIKILSDRDYHELLRLDADPSKIVTGLIALSYDKTKTVAWRAIEAIGVLSGEIAETDPEFIRTLVGKLLWMIRDESGGIGWSAPEILGEVVRNNPELCKDIAPIVISFHEESMLTSAVLWAINRMDKLNQETTDYAIKTVRPYLNSDKRIERAYAILALGTLKDRDSLAQIQKYKDDDERVSVYIDGELTEKRIGDIAHDTIKVLQTGHIDGN